MAGNPDEEKRDVFSSYHKDKGLTIYQDKHKVIPEVERYIYLLMDETTKGFDPLKGLAVIAYFER